MPFPMTHLWIADKIAELYPDKIKNPPQFYLGTLAPDSIHFRPDAVPDDKKTTHLCVGGEKWGEITNNSEWLANVLSFFDRNKKSGDMDDMDFIYGYCVHIIADIYNNISIWTPFLMKHPYELEKGYGNIYHKEAAAVDLKLAQNFGNKDKIWILLEKSHSITIPGIVFAEDIDKLKNNILYTQYSDNSPVDTSANTLATYNDAIDFIENTAEFVLRKI